MYTKEEKEKALKLYEEIKSVIKVITPTTINSKNVRRCIHSPKWRISATLYCLLMTIDLLKLSHYSVSV